MKFSKMSFVVEHELDRFFFTLFLFQLLHAKDGVVRRVIAPQFNRYHLRRAAKIIQVRQFVVVCVQRFLFVCRFHFRSQQNLIQCVSVSVCVLFISSIRANCRVAMRTTVAAPTIWCAWRTKPSGPSVRPTWSEKSLLDWRCKSLTISR